MSYKIIDTTFAPIFKQHIHSKIEKNKKEIEKLMKQKKEEKKSNPSEHDEKIKLYKELNEVYENFFKKSYGGKRKQTQNKKNKIRKTKKNK